MLTCEFSVIVFAVINLNTQPGMPSYVPKRPTMFHKKQPQAGVLADPGWVPMMGGQRQQTAPQVRRYGPVGRHSPPVNRPGRTPQQLSPPPPHHARDQHYEAPAWIGSLRHSGGPRQWELAEAEQLVGGGPAGYRTPPQTAVGIHIYFVTQYTIYKHLYRKHKRRAILQRSVGGMLISLS